MVGRAGLRLSILTVFLSLACSQLAGVAPTSSPGVDAATVQPSPTSVPDLLGEHGFEVRRRRDL